MGSDRGKAYRAGIKNAPRVPQWEEGEFLRSVVRGERGYAIPDTSENSWILKKGFG